MNPTPAPPTPSVSVVICAYTEDRWSQLVDAVESVIAQDVPADIVLVADHNDTLLSRLRARFPDLEVVPNTEQRGLSGARNSGIRAAKGEVIAFMDDDARARPGWLAGLAAGYADPNVLGVGGSIIPDWEAGRPRWFPEEFDWVVGCTYKGMPSERAFVRNAIGCNMSFRREVFDEVGLFTDGVGRIGSRPLGGEETELSIRALRRWPDRRILFDPSPTVDHVVPARRGTLGYFRSRCYAEGLSKGLVARMNGASSALATERSYAVRTLSRGAVRNVADLFAKRDPAAVLRAAAIVAGLAITTAGYLRATLPNAVSTLRTSTR